MNAYEKLRLLRAYLKATSPDERARLAREIQTLLEEERRKDETKLEPRGFHK